MLVLPLLATLALGQDTVDIGVIKNSDIQVVQKVLHPKTGRNEIGMALGWMAFDPFVTTPNVQASFDMHQSESLAVGAVAGTGWSLKNAYFKELESADNLRSPYAFKYLGSVLLGAQYAPIYGKMSVRGNRVLHYDTYATARIGMTLEKSIIPGGGMPLSPTVSLGLGSRIFAFENKVLRLEIRDDFLLQRRPLSQSTHLKQNVNLQVALTRISKPKDKGGS